MSLWSWIKRQCSPRVDKPIHLKRGIDGEIAAKEYLKSKGFQFLVSNFRWKKAEIDLIFRDKDCLVFVEVKTRSLENWTRPAAAVNATKKRLLTHAALKYLRLINNPPIILRFDIVEVIHEKGNIKNINHLPNAFSLTAPFRYG